VLEAEAAALNRETSLQYLRRLMNDPEATLARRDRAAETLARIEADILLRIEERARGGGLGQYDRCNTMAELREAAAVGTIENSKSTGISDCVGRSVEPTGKSLFQAHQKAVG
jgi:hypothetical protein